MSQRADTEGTGASNQEETTAFESSTQAKFASECSKRQGPIGTIIIFRQCVSQRHGFLFLEKF